jgi:RNA polymerase sigma factor (sigma-70 family)
MVLRLCQRVLHNPQDAEDVFQATFLILARQAASRRWRDCVASWLYQVAYHLALNARTAAARRSMREKAALPRSPADPLAEITGRELLPVIDQELTRLPKKYRAPLVLCYLEGHTRDEAAQRLGCPLGTLKSRLERGRELLRTSLARRGLTLSAALFASLLSQSVSPAAVPTTLVRATVQGALTILSAKAAAVISAPVTALVQTWLRGMFIAKLKLAVIVLTVGVAAAGTGLLAQRSLAPQQDQPRVDGERQTATKVSNQPQPVKEIQARTDAGLPEGAVARLGSPKWRNLGQFHASLLFSSDGQTIIVQDYQTLQALDFETGRVHWRVSGFGGDGLMAPLPGGQLLLLAHSVARIIDKTSGKELRQLSVGPGFERDIVSDGRRLAIHEGSGSHAYATVVYDLKTGAELWHHGGFKDPNGICYPVGFIPERSELVLQTVNHPEMGIRVLDANTQKTLREWKLPARKGFEYYKPRLSPDGKLLWAGADKNVRLWDVATGKEQFTWPGHTDDVIQAAFTADSKRLLTAGKDLTLRWWDLAAAKELGKIAFGKRAWTLAVAPDGERAAAVCGGESTLRRFDLKAGRELPLPDGHTNRIEQLAFLPDGSRLLTAGLDGTVRVWDLASKRTVQTWTPEQMSLNWLAVSSDGKLAATAGYNDGIIRIYDLTRGKELRFLTPPFQIVGGIAFAPKSSTLAAGGTIGGDSIHLWSAESGKLIKKLAGHSHGTGSVWFTSDGQRLISTVSDRALAMGLVQGQTAEATPHIWDLATGRAILLNAESARVVVPAPNGYSVAVIRQSQRTLECCLLELASGQKRLTLIAEGYTMGPLVFSPDGRLLATPRFYLPGQSSRQPGVLLWDMGTGKERHRFDAGDIWSFAFSPNGKTFATGGIDGTVLLWDMSKVPRVATATINVTDDALWADLAADASRAYQAIVNLSQMGDRGVKVLGKRLKPAVPVDPKVLAKLIDDLDDPSFAVRTKATGELTALHDRAAPALKARLKTTTSAEVRRTIEQLLDKLEGYLTDGDLLRQVRVVEVLERTEAPTARQPLEELSKGAPEARLTQEAKATLERLAKRPQVKP